MHYSVIITTLPLCIPNKWSKTQMDEVMELIVYELSACNKTV